jgi:hypothetical protein
MRRLVVGRLYPSSQIPCLLIALVPPLPPPVPLLCGNPAVPEPLYVWTTLPTTPFRRASAPSNLLLVGPSWW